jgi:hypothetical protein
MLYSGSVVAGRRQGATGELAGATGRVPGNAVGGGAHPNGGEAWRRRRSHGTAALVNGKRAPVASGDAGTTLQCRCRRGKVRATSIRDNSGEWEGLTVKRQRRWHSDGNRRGLKWCEPVRQTLRRWRRGGSSSSSTVDRRTTKRRSGWRPSAFEVEAG